MEIAGAVERLEGLRIKWWQLAVVALGFFLLRVLLEIFLGGMKPEHGGIWFHLSTLLWYCGLFLWIAVMLALAAGRKAAVAAKAAMVFWPVLLLVPVVDFITSGGSGYYLTYIGCGGTLAGEFFSFFGFFGTSHFSPGQSVASALGLFLACAYCIIKTSSYLRALAAGAAFYLIAYFFGAIPCFSFGLPLYPFIGAVFLAGLGAWYWMYKRGE